MGRPLHDITIYYHGTLIKNTPEDQEFHRTLNYISDFYHNSLDGYKPPKTSRITLHVGPNISLAGPRYFGAICIYDKIFNEEEYLSLSKHGKYKYILDLLHFAVLELSETYGWDKSVFINSYNHIMASQFKFERFYPSKTSRDKKSTGQVLLTKSVDQSILSIQIQSGGKTINKILFEKKNWFWDDMIYEYSKTCKWLDNTKFGIKDYHRQCYYSMQDDNVFNNLLTEEDFGCANLGRLTSNKL